MGKPSECTYDVDRHVWISGLDLMKTWVCNGALRRVSCSDVLLPLRFVEYCINELSMQPFTSGRAPGMLLNHEHNH